MAIADGIRRRTIEVDELARVEGEGGILVRIAGDLVEEVQLRIFEPPRMFEAFLRGRHMEEAPDITARICGICPVAYQMSACQAIERACGVEIPEGIRILRRLLYCGEWIESHALHVYMLHAPDFLGYPSAIHMAQEHREVVEQALRLKKVGNTLMTVIGGREIHPVNVRVGGFYRLPSREELSALAPELEWAKGASAEMVRLVGGFDFPDFSQNYEFVALSHPTDYAIEQGRLVSSEGDLDIDVADFEAHVEERQVPHSTALHAFMRARDAYMVGPLARYNLNFDRLTPSAKALAEEVGLKRPCNNPFRSIVVRAVETLYACEEALRLIADYQPPSAASVTVSPRAGQGCGCTEAPRGILFHRYRIDEDGRNRGSTNHAPDRPKPAEH